jgi:chemotaxis protein CheX
MKIQYINPFITSLATTFQTMLGCEVRRGVLEFKATAAPLHDYSGVIGLSGKAVGTVVVSLSANVALQATSAMLLTPAEEVLERDIIDAVGELANMVAGAAKAKLEEFEMSVSLPSVITGKAHTVRFPSNVTPVCVPFETGWGPLTLEVGMAIANVPAQAS